MGPLKILNLPQLFRSNLETLGITQPQTEVSSMKFLEGKARPALRPDKSAVLNVTEVKVNMDVQNSIPSSESACLVRQTFTFKNDFFVSYL